MKTYEITLSFGELNEAKICRDRLNSIHNAANGGDLKVLPGDNATLSSADPYIVQIGVAVVSGVTTATIVELLRPVLQHLLDGLTSKPVKVTSSSGVSIQIPQSADDADIAKAAESIVAEEP
jgi:hypothetical protein